MDLEEPVVMDVPVRIIALMRTIKAMSPQEDSVFAMAILFSELLLGVRYLTTCVSKVTFERLYSECGGPHDRKGKCTC